MDLIKRTPEVDLVGRDDRIHRFSLRPVPARRCAGSIGNNYSRILLTVMLFASMAASTTYAQESDLVERIRSAHVPLNQARDRGTTEGLDKSIDQALDVVLEASSLEEAEEDVTVAAIDLFVELMYVPIPWWNTRPDTAEELSEWLESQIPDVPAYMPYELVQWRGRCGKTESAEALNVYCLESYPDDESQMFKILQMDIDRRQERWADSIALANKLLVHFEDKENIKSDVISYLQASYIAALLFQRLGLIDRAEQALKSAMKLEVDENRSDIDSALQGCSLTLIDLYILITDAPKAGEAIQEFKSRWGAANSNLAALEALYWSIIGTGSTEKRDEAKKRIESYLENVASPSLDGTTVAIQRARLAFLDDRCDELKLWIDESQERLGELRGVPDRYLTREKGRITSIRGYWALRCSTQQDQTKELSKAQECFDELVENWMKSPLFKGGLGFLQESGRRSMLASLVALSARLEDPERSLSIAMQAQSTGTLARQEQVESPEWSDLKEHLLKDNRGILTYVIGPESSHLILSDRDGVETLELDSTETQIVRNFDHVLSALRLSPEERTADDWEDKARALFNDLIPIQVRERVMEWSHIQISGDPRFIGKIGLAMLDDGSLLCTRKPIIYLPSIPYGVFVAKRRMGRDLPTKKLFLGVGPGTTPFGDGTSFRFDENDRERLSRAFTADLVHYQGPSPDGITVIPNDTSVFEVTHLIAHGRFDRTRTQFAGLWLGPGKKFWGEDLQSSQLSDLVILSVCGAGAGHKRLGEDGVSHLGGAALAGGASTVILSRETIDFRATMHLDDQLLLQIEEGHDPATALMNAQAFMSSTSEFHDPYFYANHWVFGVSPESPRQTDTAQMKSADKTETQSLFFIGALIAVAGGVILFRRTKSRHT